MNDILYSMEKIKLPKNISYEVRFYCDKCDIEIAEDEIPEHKHKRKMTYEEKCRRYNWNPKEDVHV